MSCKNIAWRKVVVIEHSLLGKMWGERKKYMCSRENMTFSEKKKETGAQR